MDQCGLINSGTAAAEGESRVFCETFPFSSG